MQTNVETPPPSPVSGAPKKDPLEGYSEQKIAALQAKEGYRYYRGMIRDQMERLREAADRSQADAEAFGVRFEAIVELAELADTSENHRVRLRALELVLREIRRYFSDLEERDGEPDAAGPDGGPSPRRPSAPGPESRAEAGSLAASVKSQLDRLQASRAERPPLPPPNRHERRRLESERRRAEKQAQRQGNRPEERADD